MLCLWASHTQSCQPGGVHANVDIHSTCMIGTTFSKYVEYTYMYMPNCTDMSISIEYVYCLGHFLLYMLIFFPYHTPLIITQCIFFYVQGYCDHNAMHAHNMIKFSVQEILLVIKETSRSCITCLDNL